MLCVWTLIPAPAQSLYELQFTGSDGSKYLGFLVYYNETNCYMRTAFNASDGSYKVVHTDYTGVSMTEEGVNYFVLVGRDARYVTEGGGETYHPDLFIWMWEEGKPMELPYTSDDPELKDESFKKVDSYVELDVSTLTEDYLRQFYWSDEADLASFISLATGADYTLDNSYDYTEADYSYHEGETETTNNNNGNNTSTNNGNNNVSNENTNTENTNTETGNVTIHLVVVANTEIGDIGSSCEIDKRNLISEFEGVSEALGVKFKPYVIDGKDFTKKNVTTTLDRLTPGKNDVVMFVYTGHGFRWSDQTDKYPRMDLRYNSYQKVDNESSMGLSEVYDKIKTKGARLNIVFGDCCNADIGVNARTTTNFLGNRANPNFKPEKLQRLFIKCSGNLIATAASPGEVSWSNSAQGGFFIYSFLQAFHEEISFMTNDIADWEGLLKKTIDQAAYKTSDAACASCSAQNGQSIIKMTYK